MAEEEAYGPQKIICNPQKSNQYIIKLYHQAEAIKREVREAKARNCEAKGENLALFAEIEGITSGIKCAHRELHDAIEIVKKQKIGPINCLPDNIKDSTPDSIQLYQQALGIFQEFCEEKAKGWVLEVRLQAAEADPELKGFREFMAIQHNRLLQQEKDYSTLEEELGSSKRKRTEEDSK